MGAHCAWGVVSVHNTVVSLRKILMFILANSNSKSSKAYFLDLTRHTK
jgi:hypothetical protein